MLYEMLTGQCPRGAFEAPSQRVQVDVRLDSVVLKAMQQQPERRYQQVSEMKTDVDRIRTTPMQKAEGAKRKAEGKRSRVRVAAVLAASVVVLSAVGFFVWKKATVPGVAHAEENARAVASGAADSRLPTQPLAPEAPKNGARAGESRTGAIPPPTPGQPGVSPSATAAAAVTFATASKDAPFVNTLGMKFVPVPITGGPTDKQRVLFSVWETRVQDYEVFANETKRERPTSNRSQQGPTHPAVNLTWEDAQAFCTWLTENERKAGRLGVMEAYRLPTDHEWSCAVGIGGREDAARTPAQKDRVIKGVYPWCTQWPPPKGAGNFYGEEARHKPIAVQVPIAGYNDGFESNAPVGSFSRNGFGLFDLGGNVGEWCEDWYSPTAAEPRRVYRDQGCSGGRESELVSAKRCFMSPTFKNQRHEGAGFRCVVSVAPPAPTTSHPAPTAGAAEASAAGVAFTSGAALPTTGWRLLVPDWDAAKTWPGVTLLPDGWMGLTDARLPIDVQQHNVALRVRIRRGSESANPWLIVRNTTVEGKTVEEYHLNTGGTGKVATLFQRIPGSGASQGNKQIAQVTLPRALVAGDEYELAITAIGDELTIYFDGQPIGRATDAVCQGAGVNIGGSPGREGVAEFKNAEWLPLSAEPWPAPTATKPATPPSSTPAPAK